MHAAKNRKEAHHRMIKEAHEEAKERVQKLCNKHRYINRMKTYSNLPEPVIQVAVEAMHKQHGGNIGFWSGCKHIASFHIPKPEEQG